MQDQRVVSKVGNMNVDVENEELLNDEYNIAREEHNMDMDIGVNKSVSTKFILVFD